MLAVRCYLLLTLDQQSNPAAVTSSRLRCICQISVQTCHQAKYSPNSAISFSHHAPLPHMMFSTTTRRDASWQDVVWAYVIHAYAVVMFHFRAHLCNLLNYYDWLYWIQMHFVRNCIFYNRRRACPYVLSGNFKAAPPSSHGILCWKYVSNPSHQMDNGLRITDADWRADVKYFEFPATFGTISWVRCAAPSWRAPQLVSLSCINESDAMEM